MTRSGANAIHGDVYGYLRQRALQADNPFTTVPNPAYTRVQAGATLSGPLVKDRTFYFASFETTRRQETGFSTIGRNNFDLVNIDASRICAGVRSCAGDSDHYPRHRLLNRR